MIFRGSVVAFVLLILLFNLQCKDSNNKPWLAPPDILPTAAMRLPDVSAAEKARIINSPFIRSIKQSLHSYFIHRIDSNAWNGLMLVAYKGVPIFEAAHGYADIPNKILLDTGTTFHLASVSKTLTAAGVMLLYQYHLLKLDDAVQKYIPAFPYKTITINMLMSHRSGLPEYLYLADIYWPDQSKVMTNADVINILQTQQPALLTTPGSAFHYCNTNYVLLASIIEKVSKMSFAIFMKKYLFAPIGMTQTYIWTPFDSLPKHQALSHDAYGRPTAQIPGDGVVGDKNIYSTARDMLKWDRALYSNAFLSDTIKQLMFSGNSHEHKGIKNYGLGWRMYDYPSGKKVVYHNGWWRGNNTVFYRFIDDKVTLIILSNRYNRSIYNIWPLFDVLHISTAKATDDDWLTLD